MQHIKTKKIPETTSQVVYKTTCDLCGEVIKREPYSAEEVEVSHRIGDCFPEGSETSTMVFDICGKCFDEKLVIWLKNQGAIPRYEKF